MRRQCGQGSRLFILIELNFLKISKAQNVYGIVM